MSILWVVSLLCGAVTMTLGAFHHEAATAVLGAAVFLAAIIQRKDHQ